jgi:hypothetical protein
MKNFLSRHAGVIGVVSILLLFSIVAGYFQSFSGMASYDDEGTLIAWMRDAIAGQRLYDTVPTHYGPLYYAYEWLAHAPLGIPVTNNSVRFVTPFFRVLTVLVVFLLCYRMTASIFVSWGAAILAFGALSFLVSEPAHPQELCILLITLLPLTACFTGYRLGLMLWIGALAAGMTLTKVNLGVFAVAAGGLTLVFSAGRTRLWFAARILAAAAALLLPASLMWAMLGEPRVLRFCILDTLALAAALAVVGRTESDVRIRVRDLAATALGFAAALALIASFALLRGSSLSAMLECLVFTPRKTFGPLWFWPAPVSKLAIPWAVGCLLLACVAAAGRLKPNVTALLKLGMATATLVFCITDREGPLMSYIPPMLWLIAAPSEREAGHTKGNFARILLLLVSIFQLLYAFPVAGSQVPFTEICIIAIAAVCMSDALRHFEQRLPEMKIPEIRRLAAIAASVVMISICATIAGSAVRVYETRPALALSGANLIHLNPEDALSHNEVVRLARADSCRTLITLPGMPSFNVWTGLRTPPALTGGPWILALDEPAQAAVVRQVSGDAHACVIIGKEMVHVWSNQPRGYASPMANFIRDNFRSAFETHVYQFLVRR